MVHQYGKIGYGQTRQELLSAVKKILDQDGRQTPFKNNLPGKDWFYAFMKRHPEIAPRTPQKLGKERAVISWQKIVWWFEDLAKYLNDNYAEGIYILKDPSRVYNADEFTQDPKSGKILAPRGSKYVYSTCSSDKSQCLYSPGNDLEDTTHWKDSLKLFLVERKQDGWIQNYFIHGCVTTLLLHERSIKRRVILFVDGHTS